MTSFGRQFDFHDVIYHIQPCDIDNTLDNIVFTTNEHSNFMKKYMFQSKEELREILTEMADGGIVIDSEGFVNIFHFLCVRIKINSMHAVICCLKYHCLSVNLSG